MSHQGSTDLKNAPPLAIGVVVLGGLVFILSFFAWYGVSFGGDLSQFGGNFNVSSGAWDLGFTAWFPVLLALAGGVIAAMSFVSPQTLQSVKIPPFLLILTLDVLAVFLLLIRWLTVPKAGGEALGASVGMKWAFFLALLLVVAQGVLAYLAQIKSGSLSSAISSVQSSFQQPSGQQAPQAYPPPVQQMPPPQMPQTQMPPPVQPPVAPQDPNIPPQG